MAMVGLREAARQAGVNKTTILRAIQSGRLSAQKSEGGGYVIDPAELFRVYPPQPEPRTPEHRDADEGGGRNAQPLEGPDAPDATEWRGGAPPPPAHNQGPARGGGRPGGG